MTTAEVVSLQAHKDDKRRQYMQDLVTKQDVITAATSIYQDELGFWFEDEMAVEVHEAAEELYDQHCQTAQSRRELVERIADDLRGDQPAFHEVVPPPNA